MPVENGVPADQLGLAVLKQATRAAPASRSRRCPMARSPSATPATPPDLRLSTPARRSRPSWRVPGAGEFDDLA